MDGTLAVGYAASLCSVMSFTPQVWKIARTADASAISRRMYFITVVGFALWTCFGVLRGEWPIIITNAICFLLAGAILCLALLSDRTRLRLAVLIGGLRDSSAE